MTETIKQQTIGFDGEIALYDERGWSERPLHLVRQGDSSAPLVVNVKFSNTMNDDAPSAQHPIYNSAVEIHWKTGETGRKEVPLRTKAGSVQVEELYVLARLEVPLGQDVAIDKGRGRCVVRIDNEFTSASPDKSAEYLVPRRSVPVLVAPTTDPGEVSITPFQPPTV